MKLLRSERPGLSFFAKVVQLLALKCGTGLMFPEKNCCIHRPKRIEASDFNIVDGELKRTQNVVVPGSEAADGMWQKNMLTMNQQLGKRSFNLFCITFSYLNIWSCLNSELHRLQVMNDVIFVVYSRRKTRPFLFSLFSLILVANH